MVKPELFCDPVFNGSWVLQGIPRSFQQSFEWGVPELRRGGHSVTRGIGMHQMEDRERKAVRLRGVIGNVEQNQKMLESRQEFYNMLCS